MYNLVDSITYSLVLTTLIFISPLLFVIFLGIIFGVFAAGAVYFNTICELIKTIISNHN